MFKILEEDVIKAASIAKSMSDLYHLLNLSLNGRYTAQIKFILSKNNIPIPKYKAKIKCERIKKLCPICSIEFETKKNHKKEKFTCSRACANKHFRSGSNSPNYKHGNNSHRSVIKKANLLTHCHRCNYNKLPVLQIHHKDRNRFNNAIDNLLVLCPTCHEEEHYLSNDGRWGTKPKQKAKQDLKVSNL